MIGIDTNVLLRYLLQDDELQAKKAQRLFASHQKIIITDVVLTETIWTLKGKRYQMSAEDLSQIIITLLSEPSIIFEDSQVIWYALNDYLNAPKIKTSNGMKQADFSDILIHYKAKVIAQAQEEKYQMTYTFDKAAAELEGIQLL